MADAGQLFFRDRTEAIIVLPSPHGDHKSGISYNDACAMGEMYACFRDLKSLDVRTPEHLGDDIRNNLILLSGKKANLIAKDLQAFKGRSLTFDLEDGVIYDREESVVVSTQYLSGKPRTIDHVTVDYGLIVYTDNPFGGSTKLLHVAGIRGCGTLAAAIAATDRRHLQQIQKRIDLPTLRDQTTEVLVKIAARNGRVLRDSLTIEKIRVSAGAVVCRWESDDYKQLGRVTPNRLSINVIEHATPDPSTIKVWVDDHEVRFAKSPDRLKVLYALAEQARTDYLNYSPNEGWVTALELARKIWRINLQNGLVEIPAEIRREVSNVLIVWARHLEKQGNLRLDGDSKIDYEYINSEILVFDMQVKKKIADLVYLINQDERNNRSKSPLIESQMGLGYRINIHPALLFINRTAA